MNPNIKLKIAKNIFRISSENRRPILWLEKNYQTFVSNAKADLEVSLHLEKGWKKKRGTSLAPPSLRQNNRFLSQTRFFDIDMDFNNRKAVISGSEDIGIVSVMTALCSMLLIKEGGFLLHASAVLKDNFSYVFFGPSGSGKTTMARLSEDNKIILTDETTAIVRSNGSYHAYATPFSGDYGMVKKNTGGKIKAVFLLKKDDRFRHVLLKPRDAVRQLFCSAMIPAVDPGIADHLFNTFSKFTGSLPCYELYFKPQPSVWRYIDGLTK
ncbi:MAG: phosphoenolpyruvate carboxykinase (ATP) [Candidatus Omnitrophica bacterium]|nr:phosphoenolpyruvate carboxykinase (ATP) [Candidatus Omnitrophota bacterium]MDD5237052.1 phosphoenolpyruvate carboxykinase (ATP) [Candidatus Omnitrophota bacterium]MDD5610505.1 phosphoenolpyruvate carboxykinase (ATP) [Candidatus Omnitrophota bacterium]